MHDFVYLAQICMHWANNILKSALEFLVVLQQLLFQGIFIVMQGFYCIRWGCIMVVKWGYELSKCMIKLKWIKMFRLFTRNRANSGPFCSSVYTVIRSDINWVSNFSGSLNNSSNQLFKFFMIQTSRTPSLWSLFFPIRFLVAVQTFPSRMHSMRRSIVS
jgi:hypothetical protein